MSLYIILVLAGISLGNQLPINNNLMVILGIILTVIVPVGGITYAALLSGYLIASYITFNYQEIINKSNKSLASKVEAYKSANVWFNKFAGSFSIACITLTLTGSGAAYSFIFTLGSLIMIAFYFFVFLTKSERPPLLNILGIVAIAISANITILEINKIAIFAYFLCLKTIPRLITSIKSTSEGLQGSKVSAFAYGIGGHSAIYTGIVAAQTIIWGSQKDTLGTIINIAVPAMPDEFRILWAITLIVGIYLLKFIALEEIEPQKPEVNIYSEFLEIVITGLSLAFVIGSIGMTATIILLTLGITATLLMDPNMKQMFSVPMLLCNGVLV